jgi:hypothetical protein
MAISSFQATAFCGSLIRKIKLGFVSGQSLMCVLSSHSHMIADFLTCIPKGHFKNPTHIDSPRHNLGYDLRNLSILAESDQLKKRIPSESERELPRVVNPAVFITQRL